jgi:adenine phosphoribosyltransferase
MTSGTLAERIRRAIVDVPDFPRPGIVFKDLSPIYEDPALFGEVVAAAVECVRRWRADAVAAIEMRGIITGAALARQACIPLVLLRKGGKLPREALREEYALEYGTDALEMHASAPVHGRRVVVVDDLLATGGTAAAAARLVARAGGTPAGWFFIVELASLGGRARLSGAPVEALAAYD